MNIEKLITFTDEVATYLKMKHTTKSTLLQMQFIVHGTWRCTPVCTSYNTTTHYRLQPSHAQQTVQLLVIHGRLLVRLLVRPRLEGGLPVSLLARALARWRRRERHLCVTLAVGIVARNESFDARVDIHLFLTT